MVCADPVLGAQTVLGVRADVEVCAEPGARTGRLGTYWMRPRWRRVASASSRIALPSASERRSFT